MKPPPFDYFRCHTLDSAIATLSEVGEDAKVLAGGQSLVPMMNMRLARPAALVDIARIPELASLQVTAEEVRIGAGVTQLAAERSEALRSALPILGEALRYVGHVPTRARGTICGSVAHADPAAELPALMRALDARIIAAGPSGRREIAAEDFFRTFLTTALKPDEVLTEIRLPRETSTWGSAYLEAARRHGDFAFAGVAALVDVADDRRIRGIRLALSGVADVPVRASDAESALIDSPVGDTTALDEAVEAVLERLNPRSDIHASAEYRREVAGVLTRRAVVLATERAEERHAEHA